jgi:hypothetical protein
MELRMIVSDISKLRETLKAIKNIDVLYKKLKMIKLLNNSSIFHSNPMEKMCPKCSVSKSLEDFAKDTRKKTGIRSHCKSCCLIATKIYNSLHKEQIQKRKAEYRSRPEVKEMEKKKYKEYYHRPEVKARYEEYRNQPEVKERYEEYRNQPEAIERKKQLGQENAHIRNERLRERYKSDDKYHLTALIRSRLQKALQRNKINSSFDYLGCDIDFLKKWLEFRFDDSMTWSNMGTVWHVDHIIPVYSFDFNNERNKIICFHWTNLQPLSAKENLSKNSKLLLHYYFNNIVNVNRFNSKYKQYIGYQVVSESLQWLRLELRYGKNPMDKSASADEIGNPQPSL